LDKTGSNREQKRVDEYFDAQSGFWMDTYQQRNALGFINRQRQEVALKYVDELSLPKGCHVLEIGCGAGFLAIALAKRGFMVEAVDHAPAMIELTREHVKQFGMDDRVHASVEDVHELSFEERAFDLTVALGVINWLHDPKKALIQITRVLKPHGHAVLNIARAHALLNPLGIPALESALERLKFKLEKTVVHNPQNIVRPRRLMIRELKQCISEVNLVIIKERTLGFGPFEILNHSIFSDQIEGKIQRKLQQYADEGYPILRSAGGQYIILARKKQ
jgi:ubiquinone/menaquinone biosynthesis C-methylase UbiE